MWHFREPRRYFAIVAAAGPASNLLLAAAGAVLYRLLETRAMAQPLSGDGGAGGVLASILTFVVIINTLLAVFNMIPVPPLDGGNVLMGVVSEQTAHAIGWLRPYGFLILYVLMFTGILYRVMWPVTQAVLSILL
jgi:Zn-dependent protease